MTNTRVNLWGDSIQVIQSKESTNKLLEKLSNPKTITKKVKSSVDFSKLSFEDRVKYIEQKIGDKLGKYKSTTLVITSYDEYVKYIDKVVENGIVALDTETNRSVDPLTCKLMGLCLYTPGLKAAYIPVNHLDFYSKERIDELDEKQIASQLKRLVDNKVKVIYHNAAFDYQVVKCTCNVALPIYWDTMIGAQVLNENEPAKLKYQYTNKIDPDVGEYDIEDFFDVLDYDFIPVNLFALYSATDALITYKLYEWQKREFEKSENKGLYNLFLRVEMPVVLVVAEMELRGVCIDVPFAQRLSAKLHRKLDEIDKLMEEELESYKPKIAAWRLTEDAQKREPIIDKKSGLQKVDKKGNPQFSKTKSEQLDDPVNMSSPTQKAILLYDVLKLKSPDKKKPRSTDKATLAKMDFPLGKLISKRNNYEHLLNSFVDTLPTMLNPKDGKLHGQFHQLGKEEHNVVTGRFSSSDPNLQQIPAKGEGVSIRMMFKPSTEYYTYDVEDTIEISKTEEVLMQDGTYKKSYNIKPNDILDDNVVVSNVEILGDKVRLGVI